MPQERIYIEPDAWKECPFCGQELHPVNDYSSGEEYADDDVCIQVYRCPKCGSIAQVRYNFEDVTWFVDDNYEM